MIEAGARYFVVPAGHPVLAGHFPGRPIVPGVMLLEWVLEEIARLRACAPSALRIREVKFFAPLAPDSRAELHLELAAARCSFSIQHDTVTIARGILEWDAPAWQERPEAGGRAATRLMRVLALGLGRPLARGLTCLAALYFMLRRGPERAASRAYLARMPGRRAGWLDVYRHFLCFSTVTLDRVYLMADQFSRFDVRTFGYDELVASRNLKQGVLLLSAHLGSFDALRVLSLRNPDVSIRVLIDVGLNPGISDLLNTLNPQLASTIIDARRPGPALVLDMQQQLERNGMVAMLADRLRPGNPAIAANFLGARAAFPSSPWLFASALRVPVVLAFGLYRGGKRYDLHFERFAFELPRDRRERSAALEEVVQRFADRLAHFAHQAPYNWFNLYDFWDAALAPNPPPGRTADDGHGVGSQP